MGLHENMQKEPVSRLALREPILVSPDVPVRETIRMMRAAQLGCVIVVDQDRMPAGMFTENMLKQMLVSDRHRFDDPVSAHMADQCPWVRLEDPIVDVLEAMQARNVRFICVVDEEGRVVGLTGQKGLMEYIAEHFPGQVMVQRIGGTPYMHKREGA